MTIEYYKPFMVIPMPVNKNGNGPEMVPDKIVKTVFEIWDSTNQTVAICYNKDMANNITSLLNNNYETKA